MTSTPTIPSGLHRPLSLISLIPYARISISFRRLPFHSYKAGDPEPTICDMKVPEHTPDNQALRVNVLKDIDRTLKPGSPSLDCIGAFLHPAGQSWVNGLIPYLCADATLRTRFVPAKSLLDGVQSF